MFFFFFKHKTAYEMRISDWSSDVCSSDLPKHGAGRAFEPAGEQGLRRLEIILLARHEYPRARTFALVQHMNEVADGGGLPAAILGEKELDQVGGLGENDLQAASGTVGVRGEGASGRRGLRPCFEYILGICL